MSMAEALAAPPARAWRTRMRQGRRNHHDRSLGDVFTDLYMLLWLVVVYGGTLGVAARRHLQSTEAAGPPPEQYWIGMAVLVAGAGLVWQGMRTLGPLLATPAEQTWGVSTPVDRRGWLLPRFVALLLAGGFGAAVVGAVAGIGARSDALGWVALVGAVCGVLGTAAGVAAQGVAGRHLWAKLAGWVLIVAGALTAAAVVFAHYTGRSLAPPSLPAASALALVGMPLAVAAVVAALRTLPRLNLAALGAGAQLAAAAVTATVWLDPSLLSSVLEVRRWRQVGRVRSRRFRGSGRTWVLLQAELRRMTRRRGALGVWAALALGQYAVAVVAPSVAGVARLLLAYVAANRLTGGLRTVAGSPGLRRALGGDETRVRLAHVAVPALVMVLWWTVTGPAGGAPPSVADVFLLAGVVAAAYRAATRPPMSYGGFVMETPFGLFPAELLLQMARGPDVLALVILFRVLFVR